MTFDEQLRATILHKLASILGEEEAAAIMESIPPFDWSELALKRDLHVFATKKDLEAFATKKDLEAFATKKDLEAFATKQDLEAFATKQDLEAFAAKQDAEIRTIKQDLVELRAEMPTRTEMREAIREAVSASDERTDLKLQAMEHRLGERIETFRAEMHQGFRDQFHKLVVVLVPTLMSGIGMAFAAARL